MQPPLGTLIVYTCSRPPQPHCWYKPRGQTLPPFLHQCVSMSAPHTTTSLLAQAYLATTSMPVANLDNSQAHGCNTTTGKGVCMNTSMLPPLASLPCQCSGTLPCCHSQCKCMHRCCCPTSTGVLTHLTPVPHQTTTVAGMLEQA